METMNPLREARNNAHLTLRELSEMSGLSIESLSRIENNHRKPHLSTLKKLAAALNLEIAEFVGGFEGERGVTEDDRLKQMISHATGVKQMINIQTTWRELAIIIANQLMKERAQDDDKQEDEETGEEE